MLIHDYSTSQGDYGPDGRLTNNFAPDAAYSNLEYVDVRFHLHSKYRCGEGWGDRVCDRLAYNEDVREFFRRTGWDLVEPEWSGACLEAWRGDGGASEYLYLHPECFSGVIRKSTVGELVNYLTADSFGAGHDSFRLECVTLHGNYVFVDDERYRRHFSGVANEVRLALLAEFQTQRRDTFAWEDDVIRKVTRRYDLRRVNSRTKPLPKRDPSRTWIVDNCNSFDPYAYNFVSGIARELEKAGWLIRNGSGNALRRVIKSEQKARHLREEELFKEVTTT